MNDERKSEAAELTGEALTDEELDRASGGYGGSSGYYMTVGYCNGSYLPLQPEPVWDQYHEFARMYPGYQVFTYGAITKGTGLNGSPCTYRYVCLNGLWGWADSAYLY